jgi:PAS domain S-box-containing protein
LTDEVAEVSPLAADAEQERPFRSAFFAFPRPLLLIAADPPKYTILAANAALARVFGLPREGLRGVGVMEVFGPDPGPAGIEFRDAIRASYDAVLASGEADQMAVRPYSIQTRRGEQERFWTAVNTPILGADGRVTHILAAVQDVTAEVSQRRAEQVRQFLMREVDHRARNALSMVQGLIRMTQAETMAEFRRALEGRVEALARAQTSLAARRWEGASLHDVVEGELRALADPGKFSLGGPTVLLPAQEVQAMSMAVHELATNALKYGALAAADGQLSVRWSINEGEGVRLVWEESGLAGVQSPQALGFGSRMIAQLGRQLGGGTTVDWRPTGVRVELVITNPEAWGAGA